MNRIKTTLDQTARQNGLGIAFRQHNNGDWEAFFRSVRLHSLWVGNLADMWRIATGRGI